MGEHLDAFQEAEVMASNKARFFEQVNTYPVHGLKELPVDSLEGRPEVAPDVDDTPWREAFLPQSKDWQAYLDPLIVVRGAFDLPEFSSEAQIRLLTKSIVDNQSIYVNGHLVAPGIPRDDLNQSFPLAHVILHPGRNVYAVTGQRFRKQHQWDVPNTDPGVVQVVEPAPAWVRSAFNGLAQVIIQSSDQPGEIELSASAPGLLVAINLDGPLRLSDTATQPCSASGFPFASANATRV